jgi:hypothetical protein
VCGRVFGLRGVGGGRSYGAGGGGSVRLCFGAGWKWWCEGAAHGQMRVSCRVGRSRAGVEGCVIAGRWVAMVVWRLMLLPFAGSRRWLGGAKHP